MSRALSWCLSTLFLIAPVVLMGCVIAPPTEAATRPAASPIKLAQVDTTCRTDADCTVKNVGSCCGASPACVNVNSPTNPKAVAAQCRASGMMGVCGFRPIDACQCVSGQCAATRATTDTLRP
ncbi:hypothetical protein ACFFJ4_11855 [Xanthomonas dyei]|uniref:Secreted protein n=1 Tax=Xanthomonas dyei TaxID=743699 RepID=A0A2S7C794_9XANT|nr:hypothetical protein [Xanthomonas dyei]PPU57446.1 hypothetical protein XdyCFBP7245_06605 [Xanthomonas dyei]WOB27346.1 hypothetical protein NYR99_05135 [Xanthomonas dyei]WOB54968.1 hypothetical protein NYR95_05140 [Xanthomonas dyei]